MPIHSECIYSIYFFTFFSIVVYYKIPIICCWHWPWLSFFSKTDSPGAVGVMACELTASLPRSNFLPRWVVTEHVCAEYHVGCWKAGRKRHHPILWQLSVQWGAGTPTRFLQWSDGKVGVLSSDWTLLPGGRSTLHGFVSPLEAPLSLLLSPSPTPLLATPLPGPRVPPTQIPCLSSPQSNKHGPPFQLCWKLRSTKNTGRLGVCVCVSHSVMSADSLPSEPSGKPTEG